MNKCLQFQEELFFL